MSIALPACRCDPAAWGGRIRRSAERPLSAFPTIVEFAAAPVAILAPSATELPEKSTLFSWVNERQRRPGFREHDRGHHLPEHHPRDVRGESGLGCGLMGEAERR
jgi:hypothetical protein